MLTYSFANLQGESMYAHLYKCIKNDITNGVLHAEEKLPSKRMLAKNLGISLITVENAYAQLVVEGYIYSQPKRGYYVARIEQQPLPVKAERKAAPSLKTQATAQSVSFAKSSVPPDTFPYNIWARLLRNTLTTADEHALISDTSAGGVLPLRQALARHLYQFRGLNIAPEQIIIGAGTQTLYNLIVQLLGRSHVYALENPGYPQLAAAYQANDVFCRYLPMDAQGIRADVLENSGADILHISPSHQFPTGIVMPVSRRYELLRWAAKKAAVISSKMITTANSACSASLFRHCKALIPRKRLSISTPSPKRWHQPSVLATCCCHRTWHRSFMTSLAFIPVQYLILSSLHSLNLSRTVILNATSTVCAPTTAVSAIVCCSISRRPTLLPHLR